MRDSPLHRVGYVKVRDGTRLQYLDWGGNGPALVLLAGLGASAHTFDDLAPQLTDSFHVFGITRRGTGESDRPTVGYDVPSRARDDIDVFDSLKIESALLVGHSVAGDELTELGEHYPQRVSGLVYLDAAYDRSTIPPPTPDDPVFHKAPRDSRAETFSEALEVQRHSQPFGLPPAMETDLWKTARDSSGGIVASPPDQIRHSMIASERDWHPEYQLIKAPVTAVYAFSYQRPEMEMNLWGLDSVERERWNARWRKEHWAWQQQEIDRLKSEDTSVKVIVLKPAEHAVYFGNTQAVIAAIRSFLPALSKQVTRSDAGARPHR